MNTNFSPEVVLSDDTAMERAGMSRRDLSKGLLLQVLLFLRWDMCLEVVRVIWVARRVRLSGLFL